MNDEYLTYFDSFSVEHIPEKMKALIKDKKLQRIKAYGFNNVWIFLY